MTETNCDVCGDPARSFEGPGWAGDDEGWHFCRACLLELDAASYRRVTGQDKPPTDSGPCERCGRRPTEDVPGHGVTLRLCEACYRAAVHIGEVV